MCEGGREGKSGEWGRRRGSSGESWVSAAGKREQGRGGGGEGVGRRKVAEWEGRGGGGGRVGRGAAGNAEAARDPDKAQQGLCWEWSVFAPLSVEFFASVRRPVALGEDLQDANGKAGVKGPVAGEFPFTNRRAQPLPGGEPWARGPLPTRASRCAWRL